MKTPLESAFGSAANLTGWIASSHATVITSPSNRHSVAAAYFALSYEACMRGFWALSLADDQHITALLTQNVAPKAENILSGLAKKYPNSLFGTLKTSWKAMCDFTHGGGLQISRWLNGNGIGPTHSEEDALEILRYVDYVAVLAALGLNRAAGADQSAYLQWLKDWK